MTTCLGKSCSFALPQVPFVNCFQFMYYFPFGSKGRTWDLIVSVPDHCLSFYFTVMSFLTSHTDTTFPYPKGTCRLTVMSFSMEDSNIHHTLNIILQYLFV